MSNLNGPFLAFLFPEVEGRTYPFEQATYWIQHALLYIIPIYILRSGKTSGSKRYRHINLIHFQSLFRCLHH